METDERAQLNEVDLFMTVKGENDFHVLLFASMSGKNNWQIMGLSGA